MEPTTHLISLKMMVMMNRVPNIISKIILVTTVIGLSAHPSSPSGKIEILVEGLKMVSVDEIHLELKVTNQGNKAVFLRGAIDHGPDLITIEQWSPNQGWINMNCMDMAPPFVIKLYPGKTLKRIFEGKPPTSSVCRNRITHWEGKFRFRLEYFESQKSARDYPKFFYSTSQVRADSVFTFSEPFEIPPRPNP